MDNQGCLKNEKNVDKHLNIISCPHAYVKNKGVPLSHAEELKHKQRKPRNIKAERLSPWYAYTTQNYLPYEKASTMKYEIASKTEFTYLHWILKT